MLHILVVNNGIFGLESLFKDTDRVTYRFQDTAPGFALDLADADVLIVPNGSDHVAMMHARGAVRAFLDAGGSLLCFDGWFTDWVPGNRWVHDNSKATRDIRYTVGTDRHGLFRDVTLDHLQFNHGISGWWACGYIKAAPGADVVLHDTWQRPIVVLDEATTNGTIVLTASGPLADYDAPDAGELAGLGELYRSILAFLERKTASTHATS